MLEALINLLESWGINRAADQLQYLLIPGTIPFAIWETIYTTALATWWRARRAASVPCPGR